MEFTWTCAWSLSAIALLLYYVLNRYIFSTWNYFSDRGVVFERGWPLLGILGPIIFTKRSVVEIQQQLYHRLSKYRFAGIYQPGGTPTYLIIDPELIKAVTIKDFEHFVNHGLTVKPDVDPLMGRSLINMSDTRWHEMRTVLSPMFTGSKMRGMLTLMGEAIDTFVDSVRADVQQAGASGLEFNTLDLLTCSTSDVIATCAFGVKLNSYTDRENAFFTTGNSIVDAFKSMRLLLPMMVPRLCKLLGLTVAKQHDYEYFRELVRQNVDERKRLDINRNDMIDLLVQMRDGKIDDGLVRETDQNTGIATAQESFTSKATQKLKNFSDDDLVAQSLLFFVAGFSAVADTMCLVVQELAFNQDVQQRVYEEIAAVAATIPAGQRISYEQVQSMKYLDMIVAETMRMYTFAVVIERKVTKQYTMENNDGARVVLQPGELVWIPAFAIHRDPKHYPNPDKFDPERFSTMNKHNIRAGTYLPFGIGPRMCIGNRFALMQLKTTMFYLLQNFRFECSARTCVPMRIAKKIATIEPVGGFWVQIKPRMTAE